MGNATRVSVGLIAAGVLTAGLMGPASGAPSDGRWVETFESWTAVAGTNLPSGWRIENFGEGKHKMSVWPSETGHSGKRAMRMVSENPKRYENPAFAVKTIESAKEWAGSAGISFWMKGDGSSNFVSVILGVNGPKPLTDGYEAMVPLSDTNWHQVTLRWEEFVQNLLPWNASPRSPISAQTLRVDPTRVREIGFGGGYHFIFDDAAYSMELADLQLEKSLPKWEAPQVFSRGLSRTRALLGGGKPLKIMALGDSITWSAKNRTYAHLLIPALKERCGSEVMVSNQGIGGFSVRAGTIILPRAFRDMPDPDLVLIFFGANDCKAIPSGFDAAGFAAQIGDMVDRIRIRTNGKADVLVLSGAPRGGGYDIGPIVPGTELAAKNRQTGFCDSYPVFKALRAEERAICAPDGTHFSLAGHTKMEKLVFDEICRGLPERKNP